MTPEQFRQGIARFEGTVTFCQGCGNVLKDGEEFSRCQCLMPFCERGPMCHGRAKRHYDDCPVMQGVIDGRLPLILHGEI